MEGQSRLLWKTDQCIGQRFSEWPWSEFSKFIFLKGNKVV